jgi:hypothetical protein
MRLIVVTSKDTPGKDGNSTNISAVGLRIYSLAVALFRSGIPVHFISPVKPELDGIEWSNFSESKLSYQIQTSDVVLYNLTDSEASKFAKKRFIENYKIGDAIVPIHLEVLARRLEVSKNQWRSLQTLTRKEFEKVDAILVGNKQQSAYYTGLLIGYGFTSPERQIHIIETPHGWFDSDVETCSLDNYTENVLVHYGAGYDWIDVTLLSQISDELAKRDNDATLRIVGLEGPNHYSANKNHTISILIKDLQKRNNVEVIPWVPYEDRLKTLIGVDAAILLNKFTAEAAISNRTRMYDLIANEIPVISDGLDPITQKLHEIKSMLNLDGHVSARKIVNAFLDKKSLLNIRDNLRINKFLFSIEQSVIELRNFLILKIGD